MFKGKKYQDSAKLVDTSKLYDASEALALVCQTSKAKFDETIELHIRLGVDSRYADQRSLASQHGRTANRHGLLPQDTIRAEPRH